MSELDKTEFDWTDPFGLERSLTEEERMVAKSARDYATENLAPRVRDAFRDEIFDPAIMREMGEMGFLGMTLPEEFGGSGLSYTCYGLVAREMERVDSGYRSAMSVQSSLVMHPIFQFGSEAQKEKYLPGLARGERPQDRRYYVSQVLATLYRTMGIDPATTFLNGTGRPIHIVENRELVTELL